MTRLPSPRRWAQTAWGVWAMGLAWACSVSVAAEPPPKPRKPVKVTHVQPEPRLAGGETRAERERRLRRECQGRPNAGACSGYTR